MDKKKRTLILLPPIFIIGIAFVYTMNKREREKLANAPKINFENELKDIEVYSTSFERNGLFLNKKQYNGHGISWYSKVIYNNDTLSLGDIKPPFHISKKSNNDTLKITKGEKELYLLVSNEIY